MSFTRNSLGTAAAMLCWLFLRLAQAHAQSDVAGATQEPEPATPFRLHVYANLVQVPTLVLSYRKQPVPAIARESFNISLDAGRIFHPTQMRMQGNDPIALGVLLDAGGDQRELLDAFRKQFPGFVQRQLHTGDTVTLYALDCKIVRNLVSAPPDPALIQNGLDHLLAAPELHAPKSKPACGESLRLWDAVSYAASALGHLPGRRVLLVVSQGNEARSKMKLAETSEFLTDRAVALFGMRDPDVTGTNVVYAGLGRGAGSSGLRTSWPNASAENPFEALCASDGGIVLSVGTYNITRKLDEFASLLRGRYVLEFPRPDSGEPGMHLITVTVSGKGDYVIRSTGTSVSLPDPALGNDPNTLRSQPSPATFGPRKVLPHP